MNRREFLKALGGAAVAAVGVTALARVIDTPLRNGRIGRFEGMTFVEVSGGGRGGHTVTNPSVIPDPMLDDDERPEFNYHGPWGAWAEFLQS